MSGKRWKSGRRRQEKCHDAAPRRLATQKMVVDAMNAVQTIFSLHFSVSQNFTVTVFKAKPYNRA